MFVYSSARGRRVYHTEQCSYVKRIAPARRCLFQTRQDAEEAGYYSCSCCSRLGKLLKKEAKQVQAFCDKERYTCRFEKGRIVITTLLEQWLIVHDGSRDKMVVYHQNHSRKIKKNSPIEGYHVQKCRFVSIYDTLLYIYDHTHGCIQKASLPGYVKRRVYESMGPNKQMPISRRKRDLRKRKSKAAKKRCDTKHVLDLIDALGDNQRELAAYSPSHDNDILKAP